MQLMRRFFVVVVLSVVVLLMLNQQSYAADEETLKYYREDGTLVISSPNFIYYCVGNCSFDAIVPTKPGVVLMGGGADVDNAFVWMINKSIGGDFLVIRTDNDDLYNQYIYDLGPQNSVATLVILNRLGSFESFVNVTVSAADAIFFAGGDQWTYYANWKETPMSRIIQDLVFSKGIPIGGTSAGEEILGQFLYPAQFNSEEESSEALKNPYNYQIQIVTDFIAIPYLQSLICDAHFFQRDRMGRLITFVARLFADIWSPNAARGIGIDEGTAILLDLETGIADITAWYDYGCAYFLDTTTPPTKCHRDHPLTMLNIPTFRVCGNTTDVYNFMTWTPNENAGGNSTSYVLTVEDGVITSSSGSIY